MIYFESEWPVLWHRFLLFLSMVGSGLIMHFRNSRPFKWIKELLSAVNSAKPSAENRNDDGCGDDTVPHLESPIIAGLEQSHRKLDRADMKRSKSRVRTYLKKCKDRLTGHQHQSHQDEYCSADCFHEPLSIVHCGVDEGDVDASMWYIDEIGKQSASLETIVDDATKDIRDLQIRVISDSGIEELLDKYLADIYPLYFERTKAILVRQSRDVLVFTYHGCLRTFEDDFLKGFSHIASVIRRSHVSAESLGWHKGWPLTTESGDVILHIGTLDESLVRAYEVYICVRPTENSSPELCIAWRSLPLSQANSKVHYRAITSDLYNNLSPLQLEMLTDDLPQLLQNLLVGVERAISRIPLNDLSFPHKRQPNGGGGGGDSSTGSDSDACDNSSRLAIGSQISNSSSPKCALKRSDLITKNNMFNNRYLLRRFSSKLEQSSSNTAGASGESVATAAANESNKPTNVTTSNLPLFCLGNSFPHIDSDEENSDERRSLSDDDNQLPPDVIAPLSISELPEKLLTSGIHLPGTRDLNGRPLVTIDANCVTQSGINCYEAANVLLYYSTIPERTPSTSEVSFAILIAMANANDLPVVALICASLKLTAGNFKCNEILVVGTADHLLTTLPPPPPLSTSADHHNHKHSIRHIRPSDLATILPAGCVPKECGGLHQHDQTKWREFFTAIEPFQSQCVATGQRLVATMSEIRTSDLQGLPTRRQLYAQHRALSRALMDSELHNLRKRGPSVLSKLQDLAKNINNTSNATNYTKTVASSVAAEMPCTNPEVGSRLSKVMVLFNEVDRAAKRLEQLTEQRRERLRELTRQRALEDEINEVTFWMQNEGRESMQQFANVQLDNADAVKDSEQEFEKYYFVSMKHLAKARDLHDAAINMDTLKDSASNLKDCLQTFNEKLETVRDKIEGAARLHHLLGLHLRDDDVQLEMERLAEKLGASELVAKAAGNQSKPNMTSTPDKLKTSSDALCHCWREESARNDEHVDEDEEEHSKIADSGLGGCDRCEGNPKLSRVCSCQSFDEAGNLCDKSHNSDELDEDCFENPNKRFLDLHSPMEANAHLQCYSSNMELPKMEELSCLDPKTQKTLLLIMREMIGTERDYVRSLYYVIENYVGELLNRDDIPQPMRGQRNVVFGNIEKIFEFHQPHFLAELERYECNPLKVGAAFLENETKFYLYALYNKNKPKSDTLMSEYGTTFFKAKQMELNDKMDLASYLLKPVQRMGKYALLLQQLVKACNSVEGPAYQEIAADVEELQRAEEMVKFQLRHGNDLLAMDSLRDCDVNVKEQGRLLRQNEFLVWQGRGGKKSLRQVFLFEELVLFSKARRFPDHKNLDIYIYKNSIKTSDIGLTAHTGDSPTKFEIWFRKRKRGDTWTLQSMSQDIKMAWTDEISKILWKQAKKNREIRLAEMSSMGIGSKPCLDIRPSHNQINDRSITITQLGKTPKLRHSFAGVIPENCKNSRRPNSLISESSLSSSTSSSSISTGSGSNSGSKNRSGLELINEKSALNVINSKKHQRSTTLVSQLSMESGILSDISMTPDNDSHEPNWPLMRKLSNSSSTAANGNDCHNQNQRKQVELQLAQQEDPYIDDSVTVHL